MEHSLLTHVANALRSRRRQKRWMKVVSALACVVVFCTTYALILPAITLEGTSYCGIEEHTHDDTCYEQKLICQLSDEVHTHGDECYVQQQKLVCTLPEVEAHTHSAACKTVQRTLTCTLEETAGHTHSDACKTTVRELICTEAESDTHTHDDSCYKTTEQLTCGLQESAGHTHSDSCYTESESITCGKEETAGHIHGESCYETQKELQCDLEEGAAHVHGESCYEKVLTCTKEEHEHTLACYSNPKADLETSDIWERTLPEDEELSGAWAEDVLAIAESQLGYTESSKNYQVDVETGDLKGYTRYGAWYGDPYGHWCAMFASFCIDYAGVEDFPLESGCQRWIETLSEYETVTGETVSFYHPAEEYTPVPGDLIFFDADRSFNEDEDYADHVGLVVEVIEATETEPAQIKTIEGNSSNKVQYVTYELEDETILGYAQLPEKSLEEDALDGPVYHCGLEAHTHSDECYDADGQLTCTLEEHEHTVQCKAVAPETVYYCGQEDHTHTTVCTVDLSGLSDGDRAVVEHVIGLIDEMPSADEIDAKIEEFEEAEDYEGEEAYLTEAYQQIFNAYAFYSRLTDELKLLVPNADKLMELEYVWSATPYAATNTIPVYQINSYYPEDGYDPACYAAMLIWNDPEDSFDSNGSDANDGSFDVEVQESWMADMPFNYWDAIVVDSTGKITQYETSNNDKSTLTAPEGGYVLIFTNDSTHSFYLSNLNIKVGDYVTISSDIADFDFKNYPGGYDTSGTNKEGQYNGTPYCTITIGESAPTVDPEGANPVTTVASASTADFIELNLYDYFGSYSASKNGKTDINSLWDDNHKNVGFQWNGGAYPYKYYVWSQSPYWLADRNVVDNIDFGNSLITDYRITGYTDPGKSSGTNMTGNVSKGAIQVTKSEDGKYNTSDDGKINWIHTSSITNRPIGYSAHAKDSTYPYVISSTLKDGYPALVESGATQANLQYLFSDSNYAKKMNSQSIDGLFQYDEETGAYYFNSRDNHAQFDSNTNTFTLYNQIITPNFILYPFGNFLPFNDITNGGTSKWVGGMNTASSGVDEYINGIITELQKDDAYSTDKSMQQLKNMLYSYKSNWTLYVNQHPSNDCKWDNLTAADALNDFFYTGQSELAATGINWYDATGQAVLNKLYNIDYNVEKNFFFGMEMKMNFYQPKDGMTGKDKDGNGSFDYPMYFYFTGDDDVWVYVDNILFLDLSGIHRHVGGMIDFVNGKVSYYELKSKENGDIDVETDEPYYTVSFETLLKEGGIAEADLGKYLKKDANGEYTTFLDYSTHSFKFYYMERGSGSSVCRLNFNFPLIQQNTIAVEKALESNVKVLGDPDFTFQVVDKETDKPFFAEHDELGKWAYSLYDENGNAIQLSHIVNKNPDGSVKTLEVYQGNILLLKEVDGEVTHYNDDGTVREDGTPNPKLLTTDENSCFTLKAGQKAEFVGIAESWGEYYVREILPDSLEEQYDKITITGETSTTTANKVKIGETEFVGANSTVQNSNASNSFKFTNSINEELLGKLSIEKRLTAYAGSESNDKEFEFEVKLDGELLPVGTSYTVGGATKAVDTAGVIKLKAGETATISNILAGSQFEVTEVNADGYTVSYQVDDATSTTTDSATGTIETDKEVAVVVNNKEIGVQLSIPVTKAYYQYGSSARDSYFNLVQVKSIEDTETVTATNITSSADGKITVDGKAVTEEELFTLTYLEPDMTFTDGKAVFYYRLTEDNSEDKRQTDTLANNQVYVYEVTVTKSDGAMSASITGMWQGTAEPNGDLVVLDGEPTATFTNTIVGSLTLSKTVTGSAASQGKEYTFEITMDTSTVGNAPLAETKKVVKLGNGNTITLSDIPYGTTWTIQEVDTPTDMTVSYVVNNGEVQTGAIATGTITEDTSAVIVDFTNTQLYSLPESGGAGTATYTMAGLMLMLCSAAYLLYRSKRRRGEAV